MSVSPFSPFVVRVRCGDGCMRKFSAGEHFDVIEVSRSWITVRISSDLLLLHMVSAASLEAPEPVVISVSAKGRDWYCEDRGIYSFEPPDGWKSPLMTEAVRIFANAVWDARRSLPAWCFCEQLPAKVTNVSDYQCLCDTVDVAEPPPQRECDCPIDVLMHRGCQCGGG